MDVIQDLIEAISWDVIIGTSVRVLLILLLGFALMSALRLVLGKLETRLIAQSKNSGETPGEATKRVETLIRLVRQGIRVVLWLTILLVVLKEIGVDVAPILASAGVVGLAVGFGAQNLVRDVSSGFFFIMENQSTDIHQASQPPTDSLGTGVSQGHKVHGTITIDCPRTDATVMLTHGSGMSSPISALMIRA